MSDEGMAVALGGKLAYTEKKYLEYALAIREKAQNLSSGGNVIILPCPFATVLDSVWLEPHAHPVHLLKLKVSSLTPFPDAYIAASR